ILGIALGVAALITTLSVMSGFQVEIRDRMLEMVSHASLSNYGEPVGEWELIAREVKKNPQVVGVAPYIEKESLISGARNRPAMVRGIDPQLEPQVSVINQRVTQGSFDS